MKRAEVWQLDGQWIVGIDSNPFAQYRSLGRRRPISERTYALPEQSEHPTHAAALAHALAEVGLTEKNTEKEKDR